MNQTDLKRVRIQLYKATPLKLQLVEELISLIKGCFGDKVYTTGIRYDDSHLKLGKLTVQFLEIDKAEIGGVLVHWYPRYDLSTHNDPYCSVYMLSVSEIRKIINDIKKIHDYYQKHCTLLTNLK